MALDNSEYKAQIIYFSHGGGPLPILGDPGHQAMVDFMMKLPSQLHKPDAILVISAHWEESAATLIGAQNPGMFYDYYGFPEAAYEINYPAPGSPELAEKIMGILEKHQIQTHLDQKRGFDHGLFIPLKADVPAGRYPGYSTFASTRSQPVCPHRARDCLAGFIAGKYSGHRIRFFVS